MASIFDQLCLPVPIVNFLPSPSLVSPVPFLWYIQAVPCSWSLQGSWKTQELLTAAITSWSKTLRLNCSSKVLNSARDISTWHQTDWQCTAECSEKRCNWTGAGADSTKYYQARDWPRLYCNKLPGQRSLGAITLLFGVCCEVEELQGYPASAVMSLYFFQNS